MLPPEEDVQTNKQTGVLGWFRATPLPIQVCVLLVPLVTVVVLASAAQYLARRAAEEILVVVRQQTGFSFQFSGASFSVFPTLGLVLSDLSIAPADLAEAGSRVQPEVSPAAEQFSAEGTQVESQPEPLSLTLNLERLSLGVDVPALWDRELRVGQIVLKGLRVELPPAQDPGPSEAGASGAEADPAGSESAEQDKEGRPIAAIAGQLKGVWDAIPVLVDVQGVTLDGAHLVKPSSVPGASGLEAQMKGKLHLRVAAHPLQKDARLHLEVEEGTHVDVSVSQKDPSTDASARVQTVQSDLRGSVTVVLRSSGPLSSVSLETLQIQSRELTALQQGGARGDRKLQVGELGFAVTGTPTTVGLSPDACGLVFETHDLQRDPPPDAKREPEQEPTLTVKPCVLRVDLAGFDWRDPDSAGGTSHPTGGAEKSEPLSLSLEVRSHKAMLVQDHDLTSPGDVPLPGLSLVLVLMRAQAEASGAGAQSLQTGLPGGELPLFGLGTSQAPPPALAAVYAEIKDGAEEPAREPKAEQQKTVPEAALSVGVLVRPLEVIDELNRRAPGLLSASVREAMQGQRQNLSALRGSVLRSEWKMQMRLSEVLKAISAGAGTVAAADLIEKGAPRIRARLRADWFPAGGARETGAASSLAHSKQSPEIARPGFVDLLSDVNVQQKRIEAEVKTRADLKEPVLAGLPVSAFGLSADLFAAFENGKSRSGPLAAIPWQNFGFEGFGGGSVSLSVGLTDVRHRPDSSLDPALRSATWLSLVQQVGAGRLRVRATISPSTDVDVPQLEGAVDRQGQKDPLVELALRARLPASRDQATLTGRLTLAAEQEMFLPALTPANITADVSAQKTQPLFQGTVALPLNLTVQREKPTGSAEASAVQGSAVQEAWLVRLESAATADVRSLVLPELTLSELRGQLPVEQSLRVTPVVAGSRSDSGDSPVRLEWAPLLSENPFRRANSQEVSGLYSAARNVVLEKVELSRGAGEVTTLGPLSASLAVKQNQFIIDAVDADLYSGQVSGFSLVNMHPDELSVSFSGRLSQLDGAQLFQFADLRQADAALSGRAALFYTFADSRIEGRVDLAAVPRPLLERLIARSDPSGADSKMGAVRKALSLARPGRVGVDFHDGVADLNLELLLAGGGTQALRVPDLPVTGLLESRVAPLRQQIEETVRPTRAETVPGGARAVEQAHDEEQMP